MVRLSETKSAHQFTFGCNEPLCVRMMLDCWVLKSVQQCTRTLYLHAICPVTVLPTYASTSYIKNIQDHIKLIYLNTKSWNIFLLLLLRAVRVDGPHDERRLDAHGRAVRAVNSLQFARQQAVADRARASAAVALKCRSQYAHFTHLRDYAAIKLCK